MELRVIGALLDNAFSLQAIRVAHKHAQEILKSDHPFAAKKFKTGVSGIFMEVDDSLIDIRKKQHALKIVAPFLKDLEFEDDVARRWPLGEAKRNGVATCGSEVHPIDRPLAGEVFAPAMLSLAANDLLADPPVSSFYVSRLPSMPRSASTNRWPSLSTRLACAAGNSQASFSEPK